MTPVDVVDNIGNCRLADIVKPGKASLCYSAIGVSCANFPYLIFRQLRVWLTKPTFSRHILHIFSLGAKEEMLGIDTEPVIASVQDRKSVRDGAAVKTIRVAMCSFPFAQFITKKAVALCGSRPCEDPAHWGLVGTREKGIIAFHKSAATLATAKLTSAILSVASAEGELLAALRTDAEGGRLTSHRKNTSFVAMPSVPASTRGLHCA